MLEYGDKGGSVHHLTTAKIDSHLGGGGGGGGMLTKMKYGDS